MEELPTPDSEEMVELLLQLVETTPNSSVWAAHIYQKNYLQDSE
jgi:hypothetical protein